MWSKEHLHFAIRLATLVDWDCALFHFLPVLKEDPSFISKFTLSGKYFDILKKFLRVRLIEDPLIWNYRDMIRACFDLRPRGGAKMRHGQSQSYCKIWSIRALVCTIFSHLSQVAGFWVFLRPDKSQTNDSLIGTMLRDNLKEVQ